MRRLAGEPFPIVAPVEGLNLVGQGLPGVGPAVTLGVAPLLSMAHTQQTDWLRDKLMPYGPPDTAGGIVETFFPGWADKFRAAGVLAHIPYVGEIQSERQSMTIANLAKDLFSYKVSAGEVDMHDGDSIYQGWQSAQKQANRMYTWMGLAQFVAPAAPNLERNIKLKDGTVVESYLLANDYRKMLDASNGDTYKATADFIGKYGVERIFSIEPKAQRLVYGIGTGPEAQAYRREHKAFAGKFPDVFGYWAPVAAQTDRGSYADYLQAIHDGVIAPLTVQEWIQLAEARVGNTAYDQARQQVGPSPNQAQSAWLSNVRAQLAQQYPGFGVEVGHTKLTPQNRIDEITRALQNKDVPAGPLTDAAKAYLDARNQALAEARRRGLKTLGGKSVADLRQWLYRVGTTIATKTPEFTNMWNDVFQYEVDPNA